MYSNRSGYSHSRQRSERSSRQWDGYDDRWEERREPRRDAPKDAHYEDRRGSTDRAKRGRDYCDSPNWPHGKDSLNNNRSRESPARRRLSSPEWGASERKRRRYTEDDEDDYRHRRVSVDKASRRSPDGSSHAHFTKDFRHAKQPEEDSDYRRKTSQDSRQQRPRYEEFTYRQQYEDSVCRRPSRHHKERDGHERSRDRSQERTHSQDHSVKSYTKPRERNDCPSIDHEDPRQNRAKFPPHTSSGQSYESGVSGQTPAVPEENKTSKGCQGFQRFLDVLNKGVNVTLLTKIVTQIPGQENDRPHSTTSFMNTGDGPTSPGCAGRQQESRRDSSHWNEGWGSQRLPSPPSYHRSASPKRRSLSDEQSLQRGDGEQSYSSSSRRSRSPPVVEKTTLTPEDEHKHRQMQNVLQAIGMNLGFEELGQMSHRIQERLYGKKEGEAVGRHRRSRERDTRRASSPRQQSKSLSSSRSSFSPPPRDYYAKKDSCGAQSDETEARQVQAHPTVEYSQESSSSRESEPCDTNSQETTANCQAISQHPTYTASELPPAPAMSVYSPANSSPLPYLALPPRLPPVGPGLLLPHQPPFLPYPYVPPLNIFPGMLAQTRHLLPQHIGNPPPLFNLPVQPLNNAQKSKTLSRPRCLQVIETKQPG